ncbi:MAG: cobalamin biosynthesis protein P47K [Oscillospiraceae bacterium]|jgi:G3E family GTPase|nr:cobalamin biosynthesis protein P47K [Oscillospiraceae bacterium]
MNILILSGFLGSGKTTALLKLARWLVDSGRNVVILENEVGEIGVDDKILSAGGLNVRNLFSGCACCTVSGEFTAAAQRIQTELNPDLLIIETTGLADPQVCRENLKSALGIDARVAVLVDASRWNRLIFAMEKLLAAQIYGSDAVLVNKCDLVSAETLAEVDDDVLMMYKAANIVRISASDTVDESVWRAVVGEG